MDVRPYWKLALRQILPATISHWQAKALASLMISLLQLFIQFRLHIRTWSDTGKMALSFGVSAAAVLVVSFVWNVIKVPAAMYVEPKKRTAKEEQHFREAKAALEKVGPDAETLLRHLEKHGSLTFGQANPPLPTGMNYRDTRAFLHLCVDEGLATVVQTMQPGGLEPTYSIAPGMKSALDELLYPLSENPS